MEDATPIEITLRLHPSAEPLRGELRARRGERETGEREFVGWLELASAIEESRQAPEASAPRAQRE